jgi:2-hydroxy-3-keto-5-methylthiopentenyl-1-phosphate phosphatase
MTTSTPATSSLVQFPIVSQPTEACITAVHAVIVKLALQAGMSISLFDLDKTLWEPDNYGFLVDTFGRNAKLWHHADALANRVGSHVTLRHLFQLAMDQVSSDDFDFDDVIAKLKLAHKLIPGTQKLMALLEKYCVAEIAVSNGIDKLAQPMLASDGLKVEVICNHCTVSPHHILEFVPVDGEIGLSKAAVAHAFIEAGMQIVCAGGDSGADLPLILAAISQGGFGLVRKGCGLHMLLAAMDLPADSYFLYETFEDPGCLEWVEAKLIARLKEEVAA